MNLLIVFLFKAIIELFHAQKYILKSIFLGK